MDRLRVMLSSTIHDLQPEREAASRAISDFRLERFRSESMGALNRSSQQVCDEMARECDLYVLIVGERHGWVIPECGVSVTEREFDVAREADPGKILVYAKELPLGVREPRAEEFLARASDFSKGYFRSTFASAPELEERLKNDIAIWLTTRIRQRGLSLSHVFNLLRPRDILRQAGYLFLVIAFCLSALEAISRMGTAPHLAMPSGTQVLAACYEYANELLLSAAHSCAISGLAYFWALLMSGFAAALACFVLRRGARFVLSISATLGLILSVFLFLFGHTLFDFGSTSSRLSCSMLAAATVLLLTVLSEMRGLNEGYGDMRPSAYRTMLTNTMLAPSVSYAYVLAIAVVFLQDMLFPASSSGLGFLFMQSIQNVRLDVAYAAFLSALVLASGAYFVMRLLQSQIGWARVVAPIRSGATDIRPKI